MSRHASGAESLLVRATTAEAEPGAKVPPAAPSRATSSPRCHLGPLGRVSGRSTTAVLDQVVCPLIGGDPVTGCCDPVIALRM